jgi:hypothetical protein
MGLQECGGSDFSTLSSNSLHCSEAAEEALTVEM